jgi:hypothetical protein
LTFFHGALTSAKDPNHLLSLLGLVPLATDLLAPRVRLHDRDVLLLHDGLTSPDDVVAFNEWLEKQGFAPRRALAAFVARSDSPVDDGFLACLRLVEVGMSEVTRSELLRWREFPAGASSAGHIVLDFIEQERLRLGSFAGTRFLEASYRSSEPSRNHRLFDEECGRVEFAASVWPSDELRFWSRPVQYPE